MIHHLWQDVSFGARSLRKNLGFTLAAVITLALGIGGNTAIFTLTNALLLKPLPYDKPQDLVLVDVKRREANQESSNGFSLNRYELVRDHNRSFSAVAVATNDSGNLTGRGEPRQVPIARVSANFFTVLGVKPQLGRVFDPGEDRPESPPAVIISDALWHTQFGGDPHIIGQTVHLDATPSTIIGVLPADAPFPFLGPADVWWPRYYELSILTPQHIRSGVGYLTVVARLRAGVSRREAAAEMSVFNSRYGQENPRAPDAGANVSVAVGDLRDLTVAGFRTRLLLLSGSVGLLLLIACANIASLLLSRALTRHKEIAIRTALGASRGALMRQLLTESLLLSLIGGGVGLALSSAATGLIAGFSANYLPETVPVSMDWRVLLFSVSVSLSAGVIFGLAPALQLSRTDVNSAIRGEAFGISAGRSRTRLKNLLVVAEIALSVILLVSAGLLVRSFGQLLGVVPGFDARGLMTMNISLSAVKYGTGPSQIAFFNEVLRRVSALPGVRAAAVSAALPLSRIRITPILAEGQPEVPLGERPFTVIEAISPGFLQTMRIPLVAGRPFADADGANAPRVLIVNEALARRYWPHQNPLGRHVMVGRRPAAEVVGVAADAKNNGLALDTDPQLYIPFAQLPWGNMNLLVRTASEPRSLVSAVRGQISAIDPDQPVTNVQTGEELLDSSRAQPRFTMYLVGIFSATALALALVGIYGVLAFAVTERRHEIGIRLALGAERYQLLRVVLADGVVITLAGIAIGLLAAFVLTRVMASLLYKVNPRDITTFAVVPVAFLLVALLASYLPVRRAMRLDPTEIFRHT